MKNSIPLLITVCLFVSGLTAQSNFIGSGITLQFSGDDLEYVDAGDFYNTLNYPFTVEAWINISSYTFQYSCIFASDNPASNYFGFWFQLNSTGCLRLELGDGSGAGFSDRKGKQTTSAVPLNEWVHVAVICNSSTDIHFYMNGVEKTSAATDGTGSVPSVTHNSDHARIGNLDTPFDFHPFNGQIDEIRLWNDARTELELRDNMCHKMTGEESNLIGYWKCDESFVTTSIEDMSITGADASFVGAVEKINSGAPIGDESVSLYLEDWTGIKMTIHTDNDDYFRIKEIMNNPKGMHIYRVDDSPYYDDGISDHPGYYFGVFPVNGAVATQYGISYRFSPSNGVVTVENADLSTLFTKENGAITSWNNLDAVIDGEKLFIRKPGNTTRKEVIFTINDLAIQGDDANNNKETSEEIKYAAFPNPTSDFVFITNVNDDEIICLIDINGKIIEREYIIQDRICRINLTGISKGIYFVYGFKSSVSLAKIEVL